jgi:hypothetical protein
MSARAIVTVSEMARLVRLSRARFYQLVRAGVFPAPVYDKGRPVYTEEMQKVCLEVCSTHRGVNGEPVLFYARRAKKPARSSKPAVESKSVTALLDGLNALGLTTATAAKVEQVTKALFPKGTQGLNQADVLKAVFLRLRNGEE